MAENDLKRTLNGLGSLFTFASSAVAYGIFRETRDVVNCDKLLLQTSSFGGRKIDPSRF